MLFLFRYFSRYFRAFAGEARRREMRGCGAERLSDGDFWLVCRLCVPGISSPVVTPSTRAARRLTHTRPPARHECFLSNTIGLMKRHSCYRIARLC